MTAAGVEFLIESRSAPHGRFAVFRDLADNRWDLITPTVIHDTPDRHHDRPSGRRRMTIKPVIGPAVGPSWHE